MRFFRFQNFKLFYKDIEHFDSTSRLLSSLRPFILGVTGITFFVFFEELRISKNKSEDSWISKLYQQQKRKFISFKLSLFDIIELEKNSI